MSNLPFSHKITLVGIIVILVSIFSNWSIIKDGDNIKSNSAFSLNSGYVGFTILVMLGILLFLILSHINKERVKTRLRLVFYDHTIIIFFGITILLLTITIMNSIRGFIVFYENIQIGDGLVFGLIGPLFIILGGALNYKEKKDELLNKIYIENTQTKNSDLKEYEEILKGKTKGDKKNMSLPI